jgi:hypothetical protein
MNAVVAAMAVLTLATPVEAEQRKSVAPKPSLRALPPIQTMSCSATSGSVPLLAPAIGAW